MIMPTAAFGVEDSASNWDQYRSILQKKIDAQRENITIKNTGNETFSTWSVALVKAQNILEEVKGELAKYLIKLNIHTVDIVPVLSSPKDGKLEKVNYNIRYNIPKEDMDEIEG